jgi:hypothetical protein
LFWHVFQILILGDPILIRRDGAQLTPRRRVPFEKAVVPSLYLLRASVGKFGVPACVCSWCREHLRSRNQIPNFGNSPSSYLVGRDSGGLALLFGFTSGGKLCIERWLGVLAGISDADRQTLFALMLAHTTAWVFLFQNVPLVPLP